MGSLVIPNFTSTCSTLLSVPCKPFNDTLVFANDSFALTSQLMITTAFARKKNGVTNLTIVPSSTTKLTGVMRYMIVFLHLMLLLTLILPHNHLMWILLHLLLATNLLSIVNFFNGMRIVSPLVPLLLLPTQVHLFLVLLNLRLFVLRCSTQKPHILLVVTNLCFLFHLSKYLPYVTMTNGSKVLAHGIGTVNLFSFFIH